VLVGAFLLLVSALGGAAIVGMALIPVVAVWLLLKALASPHRADLRWLINGIVVVLVIVVLSSLVGGFFFPLLFLLAVICGVPLMLLRIGSDVPAALPSVPKDPEQR
jgi:xanthine/uracil permease